MSLSRFLLLVLLFGVSWVAAQKGPRLAFYNPRLDAEDPRPFVVQCLCTPSRDELMPDGEGVRDS